MLYPRIKSFDFRGEAYNLKRYEDVLSFEISVALKSEIKENPKTIIPGVRLLISKSVFPASGGMLLFIIENSKIKMIGNPSPNPIVSGSRIISFPQRDANTLVFI